MEKGPFTWTRLDITSNSPPPRLYHSAAICTAGNAASMMIVFGGRGGGQTPFQDAWGLRRHRNGKWDWIAAPCKTGEPPAKRYQHGAVFVGALMLVVGGRMSSSEWAGLEVYNTESSQWRKYRVTKRFRHASWISNSNLFIYGGFEYANPSQPIDTMIKVDLTKLFAEDETILKKLSEAEEELFASEWDAETPVPKRKLSRVKPALPIPESSTEKKSESRPLVAAKEPTIRDMLMGNMSKRATKLGPVALVAMSDSSGARIVKTVPLETLQEESKKVVVNIKGSMKKTEEAVHSIFITQLLKPKNWTVQQDFISKFTFKTEHIISLANQCIKAMKKQPMVVYLRGPVKIFGDIHGQYHDLMRFFDLWGTPSEDSEGDIEAYDYLFLGDYVDRGSHSLETICLLMALKVKYPEQVYLLRGNHEDRWINNSFGFADECSLRLGENYEDPDSIFNKINDVFDWLPLAAIIDERIICLHGGIGGSVRSVEQIAVLERPLEVVHAVQSEVQQLVIDILWSDPTDSDEDLGVQPNYIRDPNNTGNIMKYGPDRVEEFLERNKLNMVLRGHECVMDGFERFAGGMLITVFSATDYCGRHKNAGAVLFITRKFEIIPKLIYPLETGDRNWIESGENGDRPPTPPRWNTTYFNTDSSFN
eukprot:TRINITY_DN509_c0_g2_i7.p1 TRINITY_DN509_c0_g2~~TRINITY_DN509_c0_g2_i7.p1  ORF type:complete len:650 (+),score=165.79 TRINITY_DN509_c0_g2_i7:666-2615(+)